MKNLKLTMTAVAAVIAIGGAITSKAYAAPASCPDRCVSATFTCCSTAGGDTYYGVIDNGGGRVEEILQ